jgi:YfiH family protein
MQPPADWLVPDWPAPANVRALCSTRAGGRSTGPYESLNLGDHVGDDPQLVAHNRAIFERAMGARPVYMKQVHGTRVAAIDGNSEDGIEADACTTATRGIACTIMVADCLPVLLATDDGSRVGAAHAGWRGLAGGAIESTVRAMLDPSQRDASFLLAWLGPCIGPDTFEVGPEVKAAFESIDAKAADHFKACREGKWLANLPALARMRLHAMGITRINGNDGSREWCTVANPSRFFSHRRDRVSGRFAAAVWRL